MSTILTDDERRQLIQSIVLTSPGTHEQISRAVEAAVLAKLAQQEPVAWLVEGTHEGKLISHQVHLTSVDALNMAAEFVRHYPTVHTKPLYTHPAPQQADRQRVPQDREEWLAVREGHFNAAADDYFNARPILDTAANRRIFYAGHCKGYDAVAPEAPAQGKQAAEPVRDEREPSPTAGMTLGQRILHVGGRTNAAGYVEFGSVQAVDALVRHVLRDLPDSAALASTERQPLTDRLRKAREFIRADADLARGIGGKEQG